MLSRGLVVTGIRGRERQFCVMRVVACNVQHAWFASNDHKRVERTCFTIGSRPRGVSLFLGHGTLAGNSLGSP